MVIRRQDKAATRPLGKAATRRLRRLAVTRRPLSRVAIHRHPHRVVIRRHPSRAGIRLRRQGAPGYPPAPAGYPPVGPPGYGGAQPFNVGEAFSWAWNKFSKNAGPLIIATLVYGLIVVVLQVIVNLLQAAVSPGVSDYTSSGNGFSYSWSTTSMGLGGILISIVGWFVSLIVGAAIQSGYISGVLDIANGQQVSVGSFFRPRNIGQVIVAGLIVGVITTIGFFLCIIPGVIASIMLVFTVVALLDRNLSAVDAVKTSFDLSKANFGNVFVTWLAMVAIAFVGALLCGVGLIVAVPVAALILVYAWRQDHRRPGRTADPVAWFIGRR